MKITVISLAGCSATPPTIALVKDTARELEIAINLEHLIVKTQEEAREHRHLGSPTVRINGIDIDPGARETTHFGIT